MTIRTDEATAMLADVEIPLRILSAFALFYIFGFIWSDVIGRLEAREEMAFWPTLSLFGYALAGLWFGAAFAAGGVWMRRA